MEMYPDAKVLLTVRDPVRWYRSVKNTIRKNQVFRDSPLSFPIKILGKLTGFLSTPALYTLVSPTYLGSSYPGGLFGAVDGGEETAVRFYQDWVALVMIGNDQVRQGGIIFSLCGNIAYLLIIYPETA